MPFRTLIPSFTLTIVQLTMPSLILTVMLRDLRLALLSAPNFLSDKERGETAVFAG